MKILFEHELPKRLRYARMYVEVGSAALFFSINGARASWYGSIGDARRKRVAVSDRDYTRHRASSRVLEVLDGDGERIVLKTQDGYEEEWVRPYWVLAGLRRAREGRAEHNSNECEDPDLVRADQ